MVKGASSWNQRHACDFLRGCYFLGVVIFSVDSIIFCCLCNREEIITLKKGCISCKKNVNPCFQICVFLKRNTFYNLQDATNSTKQTGRREQKLADKCHGILHQAPLKLCFGLFSLYILWGNGSDSGVVVSV